MESSNLYNSLLTSIVFEMATLAILLCIAPWFYFRWTHRRLFRVANQLPSMFTKWPLIGSVTPLVVSLKGLEYLTEVLIESWQRVLKEGLSVTTFWIGPYPQILIFGREDIKKILNNSNSLSRGHQAETYLTEFQHGLLGAPVDHWKITRRHLDLMFRHSNVEKMLPSFNENGRHLVEELRGAGNTEFSTKAYEIAMLSVSHLIFDGEIKIDTKSPEFLDLLRANQLIPELVVVRYTSLWLRNDYLFDLFYGKKQQQMKRAFKNFTGISRNCKSRSNNKHPTNSNSTKIYSEEQLLSKEFTTIERAYCNLQIKDPRITERHLEEEITTFYLAGTATIGAFLSCSILALAQYNHIQDKLYNEIVEIVGPSVIDVTVDHLRRMPYLEQFIKETNRFFIFAPITIRKSKVDIKLSTCTLPANTTVFMCSGALGMDPKLYPEPEKFDPERFLVSNGNEAGKNFLPFSAGPRNCIGQVYSIFLLKILIVQLIREYKFSTDMDIHKLKRKLQVVMRYTEGCKVSLTTRK